MAQNRNSLGQFTRNPNPTKPAPVGAAPSSDTADSLRVVTQGLSALLTQIKIDRQNARRRVLTPKEKELRGKRAKASLPGLEDEIKVLEQTLKEFATLDSYKKYIEEQKVKAKAEKDKTKYQDAAESKFESGDFIGGMLFKWLGRNEPKKGDLKKEEEEKQLIEERLKLQDTLFGLEERKAKLQRLAGVAPTPTAPEAPAPEAAKPMATATPAATAEAPTPIAPEATATPAPEAAKPEVHVLEEEARVKAEQIHTETQNQTTIIQRTSDGIDKLWTEPINVNATVIDFSDPALKKLVTKLKDEGIGTGGGGGGLGGLLGGLGGAAAGTALSKGASEGGGSFLSTVSKVGKTAPIIGGVLTAGLGLMQGDSIAKAGSKGVGTTVGSIAGAALGASLGPVGMYVGGLIGGILGDVLGGLFGDFLDSLGTIFKNDRKPPPDEPQKPPQVGQKNNVTLAELTKSGLNIKQGAMAEGATVSENVKAGANMIMKSKQLGSSSTPDQITSLNDNFHKEFEHPKGNAFDFTVVDKPSEKEGQAIIKQIMDADPNVINVIDEYNHPSQHSNGGHFHVQYKSDTPKAEFIGPPAAPAKSADTPAASPAPIKQEEPPRLNRSGSPSPTPQSFDRNLFNANTESNAQGVINLNEKFNTATMTKFPATASAPSPSFVTAPIIQGAATYTNASMNDQMKTLPQTAAPNIINTTNNVGGTSTTSSQKEARDRFLPMPNYFYNVDGTSCAC